MSGNSFVASYLLAALAGIFFVQGLAVLTGERR